MGNTIIRGREEFQKRKKTINKLVRFVQVFPKKRRKKWFVIFRKTTGKKGMLLRYILLKSLAISCGDNVSIHENVYIFEPENLVVGDNVSIHPMCYLEGTGGIAIGDDVSIAHNVSLLSTTHKMSDTELPIKDQGIEEARVEIRNNVWIGCKATILMGVNVGEGSVVGANSVVTKDVRPYTVCVGSPAKEIRCRK